MWYILLVIVAGTHGAHVARNDSSVFVTYEGHAEAVRPVPFKLKGSTGTNETGTGTSVSKSVGSYDAADSDYSEHKKTKNLQTEQSSEVVFIPSENQDGGEYSRRSVVKPREKEVRVKDVMDRHTIGDIINDRVVQVETESPHEGVLFISGKNNENMEQTIKKEEEVRRSNKVAKEVKEAAAVPLNCKNLDCNNVLNSICGVKMEQKKPKYRLFLNECYFRKVNCAFSYDYNRYAAAPRDKCDNVGSHNSNRPERNFVVAPQPLPAPARRLADTEDWRTLSARRAPTSGLDGALCAHACPARCPEQYAPECAQAASGQARVFLNHCQLDLHSCTHGTIWQRRPLSDCVGNKKAEVQNNRAFIGWMQRVGIVDKKGRMVLA